MAKIDTLFMTAENDTLWSRTYIYSPTPLISLSCKLVLFRHQLKNMIYFFNPPPPHPLPSFPESRSLEPTIEHCVACRWGGDGAGDKDNLLPNV